MGRSATVILATAAVAVAACGRELRSPADFEGHRSDAVTVCAGGSTVSGIDVSQWQGSVDWASVAGSGRGFAITRIGDGTYKDPDFDSNWAGIKAAGMVRGSYLFYEAGEDPTAQANVVISAVGTLGSGDLPVTADLESGGGRPSVSDLVTWVGAVTKGTGKAPMIYTAEGYWDGTYDGDFNTYPLWVANWGVSCPDLPNGWSGWNFWQVSDDGSVPGIGGAVDTDVFDGTLQQLQAFAGVVANHPPIGFLDEADCTAIAGWSQDPDVPTQSINVDVYYGGPAGSGAQGMRLDASNDRSDLCGAIGSCDHGFSQATPRSLMDGAGHAIHAYGIDSAGGPNAELSNSPRTLTCSPTETGVRRHVIDPTSYSAWSFSSFLDLRPVPDATFNGWSAGEDWPASPQLIQGTGAPEVWLVDGVFRRHVISPDSATAWHFNLGSQVMQMPLEQVMAMPQGPDLGARPTLVQGSGPEIDMLDVAVPAPPTPDAGPAPEVDAGQDIPPDAGEPKVADAGVVSPPPADAGDDVDAGVIEVADAGAPEDAGSPVAAADAGWSDTGSSDAGATAHEPPPASEGPSSPTPKPPSGQEKGGGCEQAAAPLSLWGALALLGLATRRRRRRFDSARSPLTVSV